MSIFKTAGKKRSIGEISTMKNTNTMVPDDKYEIVRLRELGGFFVPQISKLVFGYSMYGLEEKIRKHVELNVLIADCKNNEVVKKATTKRNDVYNEMHDIITNGYDEPVKGRELREYFRSILERIKTTEQNPHYLEIVNEFEETIDDIDEYGEKIKEGYVDGCECEDCTFKKWSYVSKYGKCACSYHNGELKCHYCDDTVAPVCDDREQSSTDGLFDYHHEGCGCNSRTEKIILPPYSTEERLIMWV